MVSSNAEGLDSRPPNKPLSILLVTNHRRFKVYFRGYPWARELAKRGHDVDLLCHADTDRLKTTIEHADGFRIVHNPDLLVGATRQGWDPYCAARRAAFLFGENKHYDIIHCLDTRPAVVWPAMAYARRKGIPIVSDWIDWWGRGGLISEHRPRWYQMLFGRVETWFEEHYRNKLDGLSAISHALMERGVKLGVKRETCLVINGAADLSNFASPADRADARRALGLPLDAPVLCFSGLDVLIDLPVAIRAFELVKKKVPAAKLLLVGPGAADVKSAGVAASLAGDIVALGKKPYGELPKILPAADLFLLPYPNKVANVGRWPNKVGDYMSVGRPIITNSVGEMTALFKRHAIGRLVGETPEAMAEAAVDLIQNPMKAAEYGRTARQAAENELSWTTQIVKLENWYREILNQRRSQNAS